MMKPIAAAILVLLLAGCGIIFAVSGGDPTSPAAEATPAPSVIASVSPTQSPEPTEWPAPGSMTPDQAKEVIEETGKKAIQALKEKDWDTLAGMVHPDKGIRFTPYTYVDLEYDLVFNRDELKESAEEPEELVWGSYDGSGEPIKLTFADYYEKFVYKHDYANPEKTGYNEIFGQGNMINNMREVYPDAIFVDHYFSGFDSELAGIDWAGLSLVFEQLDGSWYLVAIVHHQWTI